MKSEHECPDCHKKVDDVRDHDDRIDFWCGVCKTAYSASFFTGKIVNDSIMQNDRS